MINAPVKALSEALFDPVYKAYKLGGLGLAILVLGSILMLVAFFLPNKDIFSYLIVFTGLMLILLVSALFFLKELLALFRAQRSVEQNKELIDLVQRAALHSTRLAYELESLIFKHSSELSEFLQTVRPHTIST